MDYNQLVRNWHSKASEEDYFSKFVFEYLAFIAHIKTQKYNGSDKDRDAIQQLKRDNSIKEMYLSKIQETKKLKKYWQKVIDELKRARLGNVSRDLNNVEEIKWWNCSHSEINQMTSEEEKKIKGMINGFDDWENMVEFWYSIRNNLFHGAKSPSDRRDQLVVKYGFLTLYELMRIMLDD